MLKKIIFIISMMLIISACETVAPQNEINETEEIQDEEFKLVLPNKLRQWAISATASSAYGSIHADGDWTPSSLIGEPDVIKCEDDPKAWVSAQEDDDLQWIELIYDKNVYVTDIRIRETLGPGAVVMIEAKSDDGYKTIFEGTDNNEECLDFFEFTYNDGELNKTDFMTDTIKITLDTNVADWNEIDAVELIGYQRNWHIEPDGNFTKVVLE
ncbi:hypothetical protein HOD20_09085 [archaeon]|nr:hypothetical protein [archaeon]MBT4352664.1 hypothetical protein [archaeon]MBT4646707.1 hypothetical protein [archaeon]MBT6821843.1 hypothetical protein [archaeon]MBT7392253.1 hypothetical protein [archaeon]